MNNQQIISPSSHNNRKLIFRFILILAILTLVGFAGFYFGFLGFIYNIMMPETFGRFPLIILSIIFGIAAFFSPCTFTVLPAYVSHYLTSEAPEPKRRIAKGFYFGLIAALGVITVNLLVGLVIATLGSTAPFAKDPREDIALVLGIRVVAGIIIAYLGVLTVLGKSFDIPFLQKFIGKASFGKSIYFYGVLYNGAALGCTGPILLGLILYALTTGSFASAFGAFLVFSLTMGTLMIFLTTSIALFKGAVVQKLLPLAPTIKKVAGYVMIVVGLAIALLTLEGNRIFVKIFFPFLQ